MSNILQESDLQHHLQILPTLGTNDTYRDTSDHTAFEHDGTCPEVLPLLFLWQLDI
jgi:hypothetical protein